MSQIEVRNVSFGYSHGTPFEIAALKNISFTIEKGEFIGIIGHTGSGKSTLMQLLNGLLQPETGEVLVDGININTDKNVSRRTRFKVGLCFQYPEYQLFEETCAKDIAFGPRNMGLSESEIRERVLVAARFVNLPESLLDESPFDISGGQKRRCAIAGVMSMYPEILILDEPTAGLDPKGRDEIYAMIETYRKERGATVIVVSHSMEDVARLADRIIVLNKGTIFTDGTVREVFAKSDELIEMGLDLPICARIIDLLRRRGYDLPKDIFTPDEAAEALLKYSGEVSRA